jgi:hypothetical protein
MGTRSLAAALLAAAFLPACTITSIGSEKGPPRVESEGLIEGHAAVGWRADDRFLRLQVLDGSSDGALAELAVWKLLRLEVGALGVGIGLGPIDLGLGTLFYDPEVPDMIRAKDAAASAPVEGCEICEREKAAAR